MNDPTRSPHHSRRAFLRYATLGGLLLGAGKLIVLNGRQGPGADFACRRQFACAGCSQFDDCLLPPAQKARQARKDSLI